MKAFQCSKCSHLIDLDERCMCEIDIDPRPSHREKGDVELCRKSFCALESKKEWHEKFFWE